MMAKKLSLMHCRQCGFPRRVSFFVKWNDNGTITQRMQSDFRVVILQFGLFDNLFSQLEARLGLPIEHIAFEAQRNASKAVFEAVFDRIPGARLLLRLDTIKRLMVEQFNIVAVMTGQCSSETVEYVPGRYGVARIENPFHLQLMAANVVGAFESIEDRPFDYSWEDEGENTYLIRIEASREKPEVAERMVLEYPRVLPGDLKLKRCPRCHVPVELSHLKWLENEGIILDGRTGVRLVMLDGYMVATVFRELAKELGDVAGELMVEAQREWVMDHVDQLGLGRGNGPLSREKFERVFRQYLEILPLYGHGNPVDFKVADSRISITVENPYEAGLVAGTLKGLYEALEKGKSSVEWERLREGVVAYTVGPA